MCFCSRKTGPVIHNGIGEVTTGQQVEMKRGEKKPER
jgi:hypothetical protein